MTLPVPTGDFGAPAAQLRLAAVGDTRDAATAAVLATELRQRLLAEAAVVAARFDDLHRRDRLITEHHAELDRREQALRERTAEIEVLEELVADGRRRLVAELLLLERARAAAVRVSVLPERSRRR